MSIPIRLCSFTRASVGVGLSLRPVEILIEGVHDCGSLCDVFLVDVAMLGQVRTSYLLVKLQSWIFVGLVEMTARAGLAMSNHCCYTFPRHPPLWWVLYR